MLTLLMWYEVQPKGVCYQQLLALGLTSPTCFLSRGEALTPIGAVEVLGAFDLAPGPHV